MSEEKRPRIRSMTTEQSNRVCGAVLAVAREWLLEQGAVDGRYGGASAMADFNRDCYVGVVQFSYSAEGDNEVSGWLTWRLDSTFTAVGEPEMRLI